MSTRKRNQPVKVAEDVGIELNGIAYGGEAVGRHEGEVVFVAGGIPGEVVRVDLYRERKSMLRGVIRGVVDASPDRVAPPCPYFGYCGGCQWQHIAYDRQLELKTRIVREQLQRIGGFADPPVRKALGSPRQWHYRNHVRFTTGRHGHLGFTRPNSHRFLAVDACLIAHPRVNQLLAEMQGRGAGLHQVVMRVGERTGQTLVYPPLASGAARTETSAPTEMEATGQARTTGGTEMEATGQAETSGGTEAGATGQGETSGRTEMETTSGAGTSGGTGMEATRPAGAAGGTEMEQAVRHDDLREELLGRTFWIDRSSFFQVNTLQAERMAELVIERLALTGSEVVVDAYCGVGAFALLLAPRAGAVIGIEESRSAIKNAERNAAGVDNVRFIAAKTEEVLPTLKERVDAVVIDPARAGCAPEVVTALVRLRPAKIVYVSCDPATLARDLRLLVEGGFELRDVQPIDMFPQTYHIENVALLERASDRA